MPALASTASSVTTPEYELDRDIRCLLEGTVDCIDATYRPALQSPVMERKKASEFPQEVLDIFHEYQHGEIDRRSFLDRVGKFAVGGLTALGILEALTPNYAWAQQVKKDDPRITTSTETVQSPQGNGTIKGYFAKPA